MDAETYHSVPLKTSRTTVPHLNDSSISSNPYELLLAEFPTNTTPVFTLSSIKHKVEHFIPTNGPPVHARACRLPPDKLAAAKEEFNNMEEMGLIRKSSSSWCLRNLVVGVLLETTGGSMMQQSRTDIQYPTFRISQQD